jgi:pimeloyl-ACP methyl ester carboxylesterase
VVAEKPDTSTLLLFSTVSCKDFGVATAPAGFNDPVRSDIPTLVLAGEYDPVTPPENSKHAAESLTRSTFVLFPGMGHGEVFATPECPEFIFRAFLTDPTGPVDTSCVASMGPPNWNLG